jgi:hypothetical protein
MKSFLISIFVATALFVANLESFGFFTSGLVGLIQLFLVPLGGLVLIVLGLVLKRRGTWILGCGLLFAVFTSFLLSGIVTRSQVTSSKNRGDEVCLALDKYHELYGDWPDELDQLVPAILPAVPISCMGLIRDIPFDYSRGQGGDYTFGFESTVFIYCYRGPEGHWICED